MQPARGTLLLKLCRDQRLQSNRIFLQTFIMPTPIMYYKSLPSHSASRSHQYSTACFSFPENKLIYIGEKKKKNLRGFTAQKRDRLRNGVKGCVCVHTQSYTVTSQPCCLLQHTSLALSCYWSLCHSSQYCFVYYSVLFHPFPAAPSKYLNSKFNSKTTEVNRQVFHWLLWAFDEVLGADSPNFFSSIPYNLFVYT